MATVSGEKWLPIHGEPILVCNLACQCTAGCQSRWTKTYSTPYHSCIAVSTCAWAGSPWLLVSPHPCRNYATASHAIPVCIMGSWNCPYAGDCYGVSVGVWELPRAVNLPA